MSKNYVILNASDVSSIDFDQVMETSADTHSEILTILAGPKWTDPDGP